MKKIFSVLLLVLSLVGFRSQAQNSSVCNPDFSFAFLNTNTVKYTPAIHGDSLLVHHEWTFGDGSPQSSFITPAHTYSMPGIYYVKHYISRVGTNGVFVCSDSIIKQVIIQQACELHANFTWHADSSNYLKLHFTNSSTPLSSTDSVRWTFGDGTSSLDVNPTHTYDHAGTYSVCLRVKKANTAGSPPCVSEICKTIVVSQPCELQAYFTWHADSSNYLKLHFTNTSTPLSSTDSVRWTFGDGTSSLDVNPTHTYDHSGTYNVCLRVKKAHTAGVPSCVSEICKTIVVSQPCELQAYFTWHADSSNYLKLHFTNNSTPLSSTDSVIWTFGDGASSLDVNPTHTYDHAGTYHVCLRVKKANTAGAPSCVSEICKTIVVSQPCELHANFTWHADSSNYLKLHFTNSSTPLSSTDSVRWTFGDGTSSLDVNPTHTYAHTGTYSVCLRVKKANTVGAPSCVSEICKTIVVSQPCELQAYFTWHADSSNYLKLHFTNNSTPLSSTDSVRWTFGDGTSSLDVNPTHTYDHAGTYHVCLRVKKAHTAGAPSCVSEICKDVIMPPQTNCDNFHLSYTYHRDALVPGKVYFNANANFPAPDQTWTITRLYNSSQQPVNLHKENPVYIFPDTGYYRVCVRAIAFERCVKEYCSNIRIEWVAQLYNLQAYPNPANNFVNVSIQLWQPKMIHAFVYNAMNVLVTEKNQQGNAGNNIVTININHLVPGPYFIKLVYGDKNQLCKIY